MPRDANGVYSLPPSYFVQAGDTVLPVQHNPPMEDMANALTNSIARDGRTVMTGNLQMGGNKVTGLGDGSSAGDSARIGQIGIEFDTLSAAKAYAPAVAPESIRTRGHSLPGDGGGALYKKVAFEPSHAGKFSITLDDGVTVAWYELVDFMVTPEMFGAVGDGLVDDSTAFKAAADFAGQEVIARNQYRLRDVKIETGGLKIRGGGTIIKPADTPRALHVLADGVRLQELKFAPEQVSAQPNVDIKLGDGISNPEIIDCVFSSPSGANIYAAVGTTGTGEQYDDFPYANNVKGLRVQGCTFNGYNNPLYLFCVEDFSIWNNKFHNTHRDAIRIREAAKNGTIIGNDFAGIGLAGTLSRDCVDTAWSGDQLIIAHNICRDLDLVAFDIKGSETLSNVPGYMSRHVIIDGNIVERCNGSAVVLVESKDAHPDFIYGFTVTRNVLRECNLALGSPDSNAAIQLNRQVRYTNVSDNQIFGCLGSGISARDDVVDEAGYISDIIVHGNIVVNNSGAGIRLANTFGAIVTNNICKNDPDLPNENAQLIGIHIAGSGVGRGAIVKHNSCINNMNQQISVVGPQSVLVCEDNIEVGANAYSGGGNAQRWRAQGRIFWTEDGSTPTSGIFERGDWILRKNPSAGVSPGYVCVEGGEMGTGSPAVFASLQTLA